MSYTFKKVNWEPCVPTKNTSIVDDYGDIVRYDLSNTICSKRLICSRGSIIRYSLFGATCSRALKYSVKLLVGMKKTDKILQVTVRKQPKVSVIKTPDGREILTKSIFYVDAQLEPNALSIKKMDKLDGETIEDIYVMCGLMNKPKMVRFITT